MAAAIRLLLVFAAALFIANPVLVSASEFDKVFQRGAQAYSEGRLDEALDAFRQAAKLEPSNGPIHANLGSVLHQLGNDDQALSEYCEAVRLKPDFAGAYASMADLLERMDRKADAAGAYGEALRLTPKEHRFLIRRSIVLRQLGRYEEALADVDASLRINDKSGYAHANRGLILLRKNEKSSASIEFVKALDLEPAYPVEAAKSGDDELIRSSLDFGAKISTRGQGGVTALMAAVANDRAATAATLIALGADVNARAADGTTALILAAGRGQVSVTDLLLRKGADIHARRNNGGSALMAAAARGYDGIAGTLIAKGMDVNAKDERGGTSLMIASERGHTATVRTLLKAKAEVNAADTKGYTALFFAAYFGRTETAAVLIEGGADVNARNTEGWTPLMGATVNQQGEVVRLLIGHGADIGIKNHSGLTAAALAGRRGDEETFGNLKKAGATETFDFTKKEAFVCGKLIFIEDGKEVGSYGLFDTPGPELFHAGSGKTMNRVQLAGLFKEAFREDGSFCWKIPRGNYMFNRINRFGAAREDHFVYPQTSFSVPYGADAYYIGTLKIHIAVKRNFFGEKSVGKMLSVEVVNDSGGSRQILTSVIPDFTGTVETSLMVHSASLPRTVQTGSSGMENWAQILNAFTIPLLMMK